MKRYGLGYLEDSFMKHSQKAERDREKCIEDLQEHGEVDLPEWLKDDFCLPVALLSMLDEILRLGQEVEDMRNEKVALGKQLDLLQEMVAPEAY